MTAIDESSPDTPEQEREDETEADIKAQKDEEEPEADAEEEAEGEEEEEEVDDGEEEEPVEDTAAAVEKLPPGKLSGEDIAVPEEELGETYELSEDEAAKVEPPSIEDLIGEERSSPLMSVLIGIIVVGVLAVIGYQWLHKGQTAAEKIKKEERAAETFGYKYATKSGTIERTIEDALAPPFDLGNAKVASVVCPAGKLSECEIAIKLPEVYWGGNKALKADAQTKAVSVIKAVFDAVKDVNQVSLKVLGILSTEPDAKPEVALEVVVARTDHAKADYAAAPGAVLEKFNPRYNKSLP